ncbi:MAG: hypothetical protein ACXVAM_06625 [Vulcanimicrobiaceae bacterium]
MRAIRTDRGRSRGSLPLVPGRPLACKVSVTHLSHPGERYVVTVDGARPQPYSRIPY